ncbi:MAG: hypothetical protein KAV41_02480 [Candidatus Pacebacteria bacterium]|nr:hypothetical protein [Candidatus Paceibacterota bacterium]
MNYIILILAGVAGFVLGKRMASGRILEKSIRNFKFLSKEKLERVRKKANISLAERTEERKEKILELLRRETAHQKELAGCNLDETKKGITRNEVEKLLGVSDQTAGRYLDELEDEGKIEQVGTAGKNVHYTLSLGHSMSK